MDTGRDLACPARQASLERSLAWRGLPRAPSAGESASPRTRPAAPRPTVESGHVKTASVSSSHSLSSSHRAAPPRHAAIARDAVARDATGGAAHALSGGAAPPARKHSAVAPRVPANPQPSGHPSTGGGVIEYSSHQAVRARRPTSRTAASGGATTAASAGAAPPPSHVPAARHPATVGDPAATHPAALSHPTATTHSPPRAPAPAPAPAPAGRYVNPVAGQA